MKIKYILSRHTVVSFPLSNFQFDFSHFRLLSPPFVAGQLPVSLVGHHSDTFGLREAQLLKKHQPVSLVGRHSDTFGLREAQLLKKHQPVSLVGRHSDTSGLREARLLKKHHPVSLAGHHSDTFGLREAQPMDKHYTECNRPSSVEYISHHDIVTCATVVAPHRFHAGPPPVCLPTAHQHKSPSTPGSDDFGDLDALDSSIDIDSKSPGSGSHSRPRSQATPPSERLLTADEAIAVAGGPQVVLRSEPTLGTVKYPASRGTTDLILVSEGLFADPNTVNIKLCSLYNKSTQPAKAEHLEAVLQNGEGIGLSLRSSNSTTGRTIGELARSFQAVYRLPTGSLVPQSQAYNTNLRMVVNPVEAFMSDHIARQFFLAALAEGSLNLTTQLRPGEGTPGHSSRLAGKLEHSASHFNRRPAGGSCAPRSAGAGRRARVGGPKRGANQRNWSAGAGRRAQVGGPQGGVNQKSEFRQKEKSGNHRRR